MLSMIVKTLFFARVYCFFRPFALARRRPPGPYLLGHWGQTFADFARRYASSREISSSSARCGGSAGLCDIVFLSDSNQYDFTFFFYNCNLSFIYQIHH